MKEISSMSTGKSLYPTRLTTRNESTRRSRVGRALMLVFPICALLAVTLYFSSPIATHAAPARPAPPCDATSCESDIPAKLAPCYQDAQSIPMTNTGGGPALSQAYTFYSSSCKGYWVEVDNKALA
jgi:hypothetical protein